MKWSPNLGPLLPLSAPFVSGVMRWYESSAVIKAAGKVTVAGHKAVGVVAKKSKALAMHSRLLGTNHQIVYVVINALRCHSPYSCIT